MKINELFKNYRLSCNITMNELSSRTGVTVLTISKFENGADIKWNTLERLLIGLGLERTVNNLIPDITERPSYQFTEVKLRKRAKKAQKKSEWIWGEDR